MKQQSLFEKIENRIIHDREESDFAYFHALMLKLEYITKIVTSGVIACVADDADRHRYSLEHKLVRANSTGEWVEALNTALVGAPAQFLSSGSRSLARDLTEQVGAEDWRHIAISGLNLAAAEVGVNTNISAKVPLRKFFDIGVQLRNRTRGHGAITASQCGKSCPDLDTSLATVVQKMKIFRLPWVYLHQNLSGKYRVLPLLNDSSPFDYLKKTQEVRLQNGVYFVLYNQHEIAEFVHVPLIFFNSDLSDVALPNGNYKVKNNEKTFEVLSYVTNNVDQREGAVWSDPPSRLPQSETEGAAVLEPLGNSFGNVPPRATDYVPRIELEQRLIEELLKRDRHPIISLTGPGGIGKTTITIASIHEIVRQESAPYDVILWISARDIDLLDSGPKPVSRRVFTQQDISRAAVQLLEPNERNLNSFDSESYFQQCLAEGAAGPTLFVLDNFETLNNPADVFSWIDTYIRPPNKVLITTRFRDFVGDYPIEIAGMLDEEASKLVDQHAASLNIERLLSAKYKKSLVRESEGHPYVMKILLGQVAKEKRAVKPKRIVAGADLLLDVLFKRTYTALSPASQRVFLLLCSWRVFVPEVAIEAVLLRPGTERFNVQKALEELFRFSLVEHSNSTEDDAIFVGVPLAAAIFGQRELDVSSFKVAIQEDRKLLMEFGAGKRGDAQRGVLPRIENLVKAVALRASNSPAELDEALPVLEYLASKFPKVYLRLAELVLEVFDDDKSKERAKTYIRNFLQTADFSERPRAWLKLADLCSLSDDPVGEIHSLCEAALLSTSDQEDLGQFANRLNNRIRGLKDDRIEDAWSVGVKELLGRVIEKLEHHRNELSATNCSRLAWLYLNVGNTERALDTARTGIEREPTNEYCQKLISSFEPC